MTRQTYKSGTDFCRASHKFFIIMLQDLQEKIKGLLKKVEYSTPPGNTTTDYTAILSLGYKSLSKPIVFSVWSSKEHACIVWAPHMQKNISSINTFHRCAASNDYSYHSSVTEMLQGLNRPTF